MLEWRQVEDEALWPEAPPSEPPPPRRSGRWLILFMLLPLLVGGGLVRRQVARQQAAMRADLLTMVEREEQARAFGMVEAIDALLPPAGVPAAWRSDYERTFRRPAPPPTSVRLLEMEALPTGVLAQVEVGDRLQLRHYLLADGQWRRAPVPAGAWGRAASHQPAGAPGVTFQARDAAFASALADDLPTLVRVAQSLYQGDPFGRIQIQPIEHAHRATARQSGDLTVVSPGLYLPDDGWSAEESVRLQIAARLLPDGAVTIPSAEGPDFGGRFAVAAVDVLRHRWALSPASYERAVAEWAAAADPVWHSPFDSAHARSADSALVVAAYLLDSEGELVLLELLGALPEASGWDELLRATVGVTAYQLEVEALAARDGDLLQLERLQVARPEADAPSLPLAAGDIETREPNLLTARLDRVAGSVAIETERATLRLPDGTTLPSSCASLWPELIVHGDWLRTGRRLAATEILAPSVAPPPPEVSPSEPGLPLALRYDFSSGDERPGWEIISLGEDGHEVNVVDRGPSLAPIRVQGDSGGALLFRAATRYCEFAWYFRVRPGSGEVDRWRVRWPAGDSFDWLTTIPGGESMLALWIPPDGRPRARASLDPDGPAQLSSLPVMERLDLLDPVGWSATDERLLVRLPSARGSFWLLDLATDELEAVSAVPAGLYPVQGEVVDEARRLLVTSTASLARDFLPRWLWRYDLASQERVLLYQASPDQEIMTTWGLVTGGAGDARVVLPIERHRDRGIELLLLRWDRPGWVQRVAEYPPGTALSSMLLCPGERLLLTFFESPDSRDPALVSTTVLSWHPTEGSRLLYEGRGPLFLWDCG